MNVTTEDDIMTTAVTAQKNIILDIHSIPGLCVFVNLSLSGTVQL